MEAIENVRSIQRYIHMLEDRRRNTAIQTLRLIYEWLDVTTVDYRYDQYITSRLEGTCDWFFRQSTYKAWASEGFNNGTARLFWLCGPPGYGKTVFTARLIDILHRTNPAATGRRISLRRTTLRLEVSHKASSGLGSRS
jgi:hypothetical protein